MKNLIIKNNILSRAFQFFGMMILGILFFSSSALAQTPVIEITFGSNPLFNVSNFLPGDTETASVEIKNNSDTTQSAYVEAVTVVDPDNLASQMLFRIFDGVNQIYTDSFEDFLNAGPVSLSNISSGQVKDYEFRVSFIDSTDNDYQGKTLGFNLCFGFSGGNQYCTNTTSVGGEQGTGGGGGGGGNTTTTSGGGGNGPLQPQSLLIFNENVQDVGEGFVPEPTASATIVWNTNIPATSQVIYGPDTGVYTFDINNLPGFGYPFWTEEDLTKVTNHSVLITGLIPGQTYVYRVVSRASPPTISYEHKFIVPILKNKNSISSAGGIDWSNNSYETETNTQNSYQNDVSNNEDNPEASSNNESNLAAVIFSDFGGIVSMCSLLSLLLLVLLYLVWSFFVRKKYEKKGLPEHKIKRLFYIYSITVISFIILILIIIRQYCPLPVLLVALIVILVKFLLDRNKLSS